MKKKEIDEYLFTLPFRNPKYSHEVYEVNIPGPEDAIEDPNKKNFTDP